MTADGSGKERELVNRLDDAGFAVMRAPSSGSATDRELPDVLAGNGMVVIAIEAKYRNADTYYFDKEEAEDLAYFAENFGAAPRFAFRWNGNQYDTNWRLAPVDWPTMTKTKCKVNFERADRELLTLEEWLDSL